MNKENDIVIDHEGLVKGPHLIEWNERIRRSSVRDKILSIVEGICYLTLIACVFAFLFKAYQFVRVSIKHDKAKILSEEYWSTLYTIQEIPVHLFMIVGAFMVFARIILPIIWRYK